MNERGTMKNKDRVYTNVTKQRSHTMSHIRRENTSIEVELRKALWEKGFRYRKNYKDLPGAPDICMTKYKIVILCDSEFFHGKDWDIKRPKVANGNNGNYWVKKIEENMDRDKSIDKRLLFLGWTVIHFWGQEIMKNTDECIKIIEETIFDIEMGDKDIDEIL